jgi:hypothetical protein
LIATMLWSPLTGLQVNITPETSASTICWTATPIAGSPAAAPSRARYVIAGGPYRLTQQSRTASHTPSVPRTQRYVSCWPANVASRLSSPSALDRTATGGSPSSA